MLKVRQAKRIGVHGHRGSRGTHPENTMPGFEESVAAGADFFELDIHLSADDIPIVFHDPRITSRVCPGVTQPVSLRKLTAREIAKYDAGGSSIPLLEDVLRWAARDKTNRRINIEIKMEATQPVFMPDPELMAERVRGLLHKHGMLQDVIVQSFDFRPLQILRMLEPELTISCLYESGDAFAEVTGAVGGTIAAPNHSLVTKANVKECHDRGIEVLPWTVNTVQDWRRVIDCGVDGIITDKPRELLQWIKSSA